VGAIHVNIRDSQAADLLRDSIALGLWELLRRSARNLSIGDLCTASRHPPALVQRALDSLCSNGMADRVRAGGRRTQVTYRARGERLVVRVADDSDEARFREVQHSHEAAVDRLAASARHTQHPGTDRHASGAAALRLVAPVHLCDADLAEVRLRLTELQRLIELLGERRVASRDPLPNLCGHVVSIRLDALPEPCLPIPRLERQAGDAPADTAADQPRRPGRPIATELSRREWDVALALVRGLTREEVARELSVSVHTVATLTKRIYRKLGIGRRAQLAERLRIEAARRRL
jgi:DNA-binding CsgD family transcriptional regulator